MGSSGFGEWGEADAGAEGEEGAVGAFRAAGDADAAAVVDQAVAEVNPLLFGEQLHQVLLDFYGIAVFGQAEQVGDAADVSVDDDAAGDVEGGAKEDVGGLAADAGERDQFFECARELAAEFINEFFRHAADAGGFGSEEAERADDLFDFRLGRAG